MDWQQLKSFYTIAQLGSITRSADALFRTQSALSQQIAKLEQDLNCILFNRIGKKNLELTQEGKELFLFAEDIFLKERELKDKLHSLSGKFNGCLYITAPYAVNCFILSRVVSKFTTQYANTHIHITDSTPQRCIDMVLQGKSDFCFVHGSTIPESLKTIPWMRGQYMAVVQKGHTLEKIEHISLQDIVQYSLNLPPPHVKASARDNLDKLCDKMGLSYFTAVESPNVNVSMSYAMNGIGVAILLCYQPMIDAYSDRASFIPLSHIFPDDSLTIGMRKDIELTSNKEEFLRFILEQ